MEETPIAKDVELNTKEENIDFQALSFTIKELYDNYNELSTSKQLGLINLVLKISLTRDGSKLVVPTME